MESKKTERKRLAGEAKAVRQATQDVGKPAGVSSHLDDPNLLAELEAHDRREANKARARERQEEAAQLDAVKARRARRRYDKALKVARGRARKKAIRGGKCKIVHHEVIEADRQKRVNQDDPEAAEELKRKAAGMDADGVEANQSKGVQHETDRRANRPLLPRRP